MSALWLGMGIGAFLFVGTLAICLVMGGKHDDE